MKDRRQKDENFRLLCNARGMINRYLQNMKSERTMEIIGLSIEDFKEHLIGTFVKEYGREPEQGEKLHVDHIVPLISANTDEERFALNHYTNLRWLTAEDNLKKGAKCKKDKE